VENELIQAARNGDLDQVRRLLEEQGANVMAKTHHGETPLHLASKNGHNKVVNLLLEKGALINDKDKWGNTPLHWASSSGYEKVVAILLDKGALVNDKNNDGSTEGFRPEPLQGCR
jgi:ankyrin repeat protein